MLDVFWRDLRYTGRMLRRTPLFTLTVVVTLMLGIGATTTIFSVVRAVILTPLPFGAPDRLVWIAERNDRLNLTQFSASSANYLSWKPRMHAFEDVGAIGFGSYNLSGDASEPEQLSGGPITTSVLSVLGLRPIVGRGFRPGEEAAGAPRVILISEALWRRRFGGTDTVIGRHVTVNAADAEIVGVVPAALALVSQGDIWVPLDPAADPRHLNHVVVAIGRRRASVTLAQAQADMDAVARSVGAEVPEVKDWGIELITFTDWIVGRQLETSLWVLFGAVGCVLLIACANVANLLLSRALVREKELALRTAIGATRGRLMGQLLVESVVLSALGGLAGLALASTGVRILNASLPPNVLPALDIAINGGVLMFAALVSVLTGLLFGLAPAWSMSRADLHSVLKQASRTSTTGRRWLRSSLAAGELALATMLLIGAGLLGQTLTQLQRQPIGFTPDRLLTFQVSPPVSTYALDSKAPVFYAALIDALRAIPGVSAAAVSSGLPFGNGNYTTTPMTGLGGLTEAPYPIDWRIVSPDFFRVMNIPLLSGRAFTNADRAEAGNVAVVSQATARRFWGDADPIGRTIRIAANAREYTIVGLVGDVRDSSLSQDSPALYYPSPTRVWPRMDLVVRTTVEPTSIVAEVRQAVRRLDPGIPISNVRTETDWVSANAAQPRLNAVLLGIFSVVALLIAGVGVYGILAYSVSQRTREIGLRMALGASRGGVLRLVVAEGMIVGLIGVGVGLGGALALGRAIASIVFGVPVHDPATFLGVTGVLLTVALAACLLPAARASRVDPQIALRGD
jgi:putative ABC transport system permease protein